MGLPLVLCWDDARLLPIYTLTHTPHKPRHTHTHPAGYSRPASGYMGIGLAWPTAEVEAVTVEISRLADAKVLYNG